MSESSKITFTEFDGGIRVDKVATKSSAPKTVKTRSQSALSRVLRSAFLPEGYPESVTSDYTGFQTWDTIQALSSYVRGMLASQAILQGVGVGKEAATPLGAVFQFFIRDLLGMLGSIVFTYTQGTSFDSCAKQWRLFADVTNDMGMAIELASPFFPSMFLLMACVGSLARSLTGVAGGATRAALTMHFARQGNAADVAAKEQSQETATTMIGMLLGMLVTRVTGDNFFLSWAIFIFLTYVHIHANIRAMRCLVLTSLNKPRLEYIVKTYLQEGRMSTPIELSDTEDLLPPPYHALRRLVRMKHDVQIVFGVQPSTLASSRPDLLNSPSNSIPLLKPQSLDALQGPVKFKDAWKQPESSPCIVGCAKGTVLVVLRKEASDNGRLQAYVQACVVKHLLDKHPVKTPDLVTYQDAERQAAKWMTERYCAFVEQLSVCGWKTDKVTLPRPVWTADWVEDKGPTKKKQ